MNYYSIESPTDHLEHYGVKGMKWGVRKAIAAGDQRALDRHYRKAAKKLKKLQDIGLHSGKYAAKSAAYGAAAAGTGTLAVTGVKGARAALNASGNLLYNAGVSLDKTAYALPQGRKKKIVAGIGRLVGSAGKSISGAGDAINNWAYVHGDNKVDRHTVISKKTYTKKLSDGQVLEMNHVDKIPLTNNQLFRLGTGLASAGLAAKSAQNAYRASHGAKYRQKAVQWKKDMDDAFKGTKYEGSYIVPKRKYRVRRR